MDCDIEEYEHELWQIQKTIRETQLSGRWFRTVDKNTCTYCPFFGICSAGSFNPDGPLPEGFIKVSNINPELSNGHSASTDQEASATTT